MIKQNTYMSRILMMLIMMVMGVGSAWGQTHTETRDGVTYNVVYLNLGGGSDSKDGSSVANAVKTWAKAYEKLPAYTGTTDADRDAAWDSNIIVVCDASNNQLNTLSATNKAPATITGVWPWTAENTTAAKVKAGGAVYVKTGNDTDGPSLGMDTKFKYLLFRSVSSVGSGQAYLQCYLHDVTFDVGCVMDIAADLSVDNGLTKGNNAPDLHLMMYANTHNFTNTTDGGWPAQTKPMVLTIKSGKIGRLLSCRITGTKSNDGSIKNRYVVGNPSHPLTAILNLDIDPNTSEGEWNSKGYTNDIEFCCAGATQGIEYCDIKFNIKRGKIGTLVSACQGMSITQTKNLGLSNSSFFGRTEVNLIPNNSDDDITINRYYGACLGRSQSSPSSSSGTDGISNTAFYGISTLNMYGGRINNGAFISAGGVSGLQSTDGNYHTCDQYIPYLDDAAAYKNYPYMGIKYQPYDASKTITKVKTIMNGTEEVIDLAKTVSTFNIFGGEIKGGIYGGSFGYSEVMKVAQTMEQAGSLWGDTHVNIYGGKISGGVYGGGQGSPNFYNLATSETERNKFTTVASVYGNTYVNIYGGEIDGGIYGGGKGEKYQTEHSGEVIYNFTNVTVTTTENEFLDIAKVIGNTNVVIDPRMLKPHNLWDDPAVPEFTGPNPNWTYTGNIYGGGALGAVEGNTNVIIKGGIINGNVFGAGEGEDGHPDKAMVKGDTKVIIGEKQ